MRDSNPFLYWTLIGLSLIVYYIYLSSIQRLLKKVDKSCREMNPYAVYLMFIPVFNIVWQFILVRDVALSIRSEFDSREAPLREERPGYDLGLLMCLFNCFGFIGFYSAAFAFLPVIFWIAYWVKLSYYSRLLNKPRPIKYHQGGAPANKSGDLELFRDRLQ